VEKGRGLFARTDTFSSYFQCKVYIESTEKWDGSSCAEVASDKIQANEDGSAVIDCECTTPGFIGVFLQIADGTDILLPQVKESMYAYTSTCTRMCGCP
jgi:hypothetical protein